MMMRQNMKSGVGWFAALVLAALWSTQAWADVAPPKGQVRIGTMYAIKAPKAEPKANLLLIRTSQHDPKNLAMEPFVWGRPFSPDRCYRCQTRLVALNAAQAQKLVGMVEKHPAFAKQHKVLKKLKGADKLQVLSRLSFRSLTEAAQGPKAKPLTKAIVDFFKNEKLASSAVLAARITVPEKHKGSIAMRYMTFEKMEGQKIELKQIGQTFRPDPKARGMMPRQRHRRKRIALARNPWFYVGVLVLLAVVFLSTRRRETRR